MNTNNTSTISCCECCKDIPLDAALTPEGSEYVVHFCGLGSKSAGHRTRCHFQLRRIATDGVLGLTLSATSKSHFSGAARISRPDGY